MTEGGGAHMAGQVPLDFDFVRAIPDLAHRYGTLWHLDEVVTGFRDDPGGFQAIVGVKPDMTSFGKIVSGGMPGGALVGKADIMAPFSAGAPPEKRVKHSGTWNGNPVTSAAGIACLTIAKTGEPQIKANASAADLRRKANPKLREAGLDAWLYGRSVTHLYLGPIAKEPTDETHPPTMDVETITGMVPAKERLSLHLLQRGVATLGGRLFVMSAAHTEADIDQTVSALVDSLKAMKGEGYL
jgi:glutamate-1-semialdehyde 2,1-aminomutase